VCSVWWIYSQVLRLEEGHGDVAVMEGNADRKQRSERKMWEWEREWDFTGMFMKDSESKI
jgi:hypothetical protein